MKQIEINPKDLICINLIVTQKKGLPAIELRRNITNIDTIKNIVYCALNDIPCTILPTFNNKFISLNALQEKGLIYFDKETNEYNFNI